MLGTAPCILQFTNYALHVHPSVGCRFSFLRGYRSASKFTYAIASPPQAAAAADLDGYYGGKPAAPAADAAAAASPPASESGPDAAVRAAKAKKLREAVARDPALKKKLDAVRP